MKGLAETDQILIVGKSGMRNDVRAVAVANSGSKIDITLEPAKTIRIKVVTTDDRPLQGVIVTPACATAFGKFSYEPLQKQIFTDENGVWEWNDAPDGEIQYRIGADTGRVPGVVSRDKTYRTDQDVYSLKPQETPHRIVAEEYDRPPGENLPWGPSSEYTSWKASKKLTVRVLDENLKPLAGALVEPHAPPGTYYSDGISVKEPFATDENGIVIFDFTQADLSNIDDFEIRVSAENYPVASFFDTYKTMENYHGVSRKTLPDTFDAVLSPKDTLTGVVRDEEGQPVEGATVLLSRDAYWPQTNALPRPIDSTVSTTTNASGLWKMRMPDFLLRDPAFVERLHTVVSKDGYLVNSKPLVPFQRIVTMKKAKRLSIRVTDEEGEPLGKVTVYRDHSPCGKTNANGEWAYDFDVKHKRASLLLYKPGMSYRTHTVDLNGEIGNLHYTLKRGRNIRVRFVLDDQAIIPQLTWVSILTVPQKGDFFRSRNIHALKNPLPNENGVFVLENMPDGEAYYQFTFADQQDFRTEELQYAFAPGDAEQVVRLVRARNINKPVDSDFSRETPYGMIQYSQAGFSLP